VAGTSSSGGPHEGPVLSGSYDEHPARHLLVIQERGDQQAMSRIRVILLGLAAACAVSAASSATALANDLCDTSATGTHGQYCVNGQELGSPTEGARNETSNNTGLGSATLTAAGIIITCTTLSDTGTIKEKDSTNGTSETTSTFTGCTALPKCIVENGEVVGEVKPFTSKDELVVEAGVLKDKFTPQAGAVFVTIDLDNASGQTCPVEHIEVRGHANATPDNEAEHATHVLTFNTGAGELTVGGAEAKFKAEINVSLTTGENWSAVKAAAS
jgi:hypothetical protein